MKASVQVARRRRRPATAAKKTSKKKSKRINRTKWMTQKRTTILIIDGGDKHQTLVRIVEGLGFQAQVVPTFEEACVAGNHRTLGVIYVATDRKKETQETVLRIRGHVPFASVPLIAVVNTTSSGAVVRSLYESGASAVFYWPDEALLLPQLLPEIFGTPGLRGRAGASSLARAVNNRVRALLDVSRLRVYEQDGHVTIEGCVDSLTQAREIDEVVARVPGVRSLNIESLEVEPKPRKDSEIRRHARSLLKSTSDIDAKTLAISVTEGVLTLAGTVDDRKELERVCGLLAHVKGLRRLDNLTTISHEGKRHSSRLASRLQQDVEAAAPEAQVNVAVFGDSAVLSGFAPSLATKRTLERVVSQRDGIRRVVSKVDVRPTMGTH